MRDLAPPPPLIEGISSNFPLHVTCDEFDLNLPFIYTHTYMDQVNCKSTNKVIMLFEKRSAQLICSWGNVIFILNSPRPIDGCPP